LGKNWQKRRSKAQERDVTGRAWESYLWQAEKGERGKKKETSPVGPHKSNMSIGGKKKGKVDVDIGEKGED